MADDAKGVNVSLLDKEYLVACPDDERDSLFASANLLNNRMRNLRDSGKVIGSERIAVMAALNIAHEYLEYKKQKEGYTVIMDAGIRRLQEKVSGALDKNR